MVWSQRRRRIRQLLEPQNRSNPRMRRPPYNRTLRLDALEDRSVPSTTGLIAFGADAGGGPHVRVVDGDTGAEVRSFFAYDPTFTGGVRVAVGDVNGDGVADIV